MEVGFHCKLILSPSFLSVGRIVCRENRRPTKPFTASPHPISALQHLTGGNESQYFHPTLIALSIADEKNPQLNLPPIAHEDLAELGVESQLISFVISATLQTERSPNNSQLTPADAERLIENLDKVNPLPRTLIHALNPRRPDRVTIAAATQSPR